MKPFGYIAACLAAVFLVVMGAVAFTVGRVTAPSEQAEENSTRPAAAKTEAVRHIPITRATAQNNGDPNNQLSPVYPASPGKDLPMKKEVPAKDVAAAEPAQTDGKAGAQDDTPQDDAPQGATQTATAQTSAPQNTSPQITSAQTGAPQSVGMLSQSPQTCNIQACENAYRSFRASDCSYQPYDGPRQLCTVTDDGNDNRDGNDSRQVRTALPRPSSPPPAATHAPERSHAARDDADELRAVEREVRRLPLPSRYDPGERRGGVVVMEAPDGTRYGVRRNWVYER